MSEKNTPIDRAVPEFWKVARIPDATPRCFAGTLLMIDDVSGGERAACPLDGITRAQALDWMRSRAIDAHLDGDRMLSQLHFTIAAHPTDTGGVFERPTDGTLEELSRWYADASIVLEERRRAISGAGAVRCWPHHFDIATLAARLAELHPWESPEITASPITWCADRYAEWVERTTLDEPEG